MLESLLVVLVVLIVLSLVLYAARLIPIPGPLAPTIRWVIVIVACLIAAIYLAQRFL